MGVVICRSDAEDDVAPVLSAPPEALEGVERVPREPARELAWVYLLRGVG
jgi:hypothetical protein